MIRVGIDARLLSEQITGIGRYTSEMTKELVNKKGHFYLYTASPIGENFLANYQNVTIRSANFKSRIGRMIWSQTYLPYWAARDKLDIFWGPTHRLPPILSARIAKVVTIHDLVWKYAGSTMRPLSKFIEKRLMPKAIKMADRIVTDSYSTAEGVALEYDKAKGKIRTIYLGPSNLPPPLNQESLIEIGVTQPYFLFVGTKEPRKNIERLIAAFASVQKDIRTDVILVIAGGKGWGNINIDQLIHDEGLEQRIVQTGYVNDLELSTLYANALFLAMPSLYEGFGLPIVEAMSFGTPVLTSNASSMPEVAGDAGVLVDPFDVNSIASGITTILDPEVSSRLSSLAIPSALRFSWSTAAEELWGLFEEVLNDKKAS